jgi:hypothetical protein
MIKYLLSPPEVQQAAKIGKHGVASLGSHLHATE